MIIYELEKRGTVVPLPWKSNKNTHTHARLEGANDRPKWLVSFITRERRNEISLIFLLTRKRLMLRDSRNFVCRGAEHLETTMQWWRKQAVLNTSIYGRFYGSNRMPWVYIRCHNQITNILILNCRKTPNPFFISITKSYRPLQYWCQRFCERGHCSVHCGFINVSVKCAIWINSAHNGLFT